MTTFVRVTQSVCQLVVVEAYRLDRYDNFLHRYLEGTQGDVVEAYRLDRYDNKMRLCHGDTMLL